MLTRRFFLRASAMAMAGVGAAPAWLVRAAAAGGHGRRKILVAIFQRGAADGLNIVVPFFEKRYYDCVRRIAVPPPGQAERRHRSRRPLRAAPVAAAAEAALGQQTAGDRRGHRLARSDALAFRRAGLHGVGHARQG